MVDVNVTPSENGPYLVSGAVRLTDIDGRELPHGEHMALCYYNLKNQRRKLIEAPDWDVEFVATSRNGRYLAWAVRIFSAKAEKTPAKR